MSPTYNPSTQQREEDRCKPKAEVCVVAHTFSTSTLIPEAEASWISMSSKSA